MSGDYKPEVGHRARVVLEGEVTNASPDALRLIDDQGFGYWVYLSHGVAVSVERLPDSKPPVYLWNDVLTCRHGVAYIYDGKNLRDGDGDIVVHRCDPLTLRLRDGKPVSA